MGIFAYARNPGLESLFPRHTVRTSSSRRSAPSPSPEKLPETHRPLSYSQSIERVALPPSLSKSLSSPVATLHNLFNGHYQNTADLSDQRIKKPEYLYERKGVRE